MTSEPSDDRGGVQPPLTGSCAELLDELDRYLDGECTRDVAETVRSHLDDCGECVQHVRVRRRLREVLAASCPCEAPDGLRGRILDSLGLPPTPSS